ncbi:hypothetical protein BIW11_14337 [Tropilaelaps mercedesae]|uniref:Cuticle protein 16.8-like n=1 Tax=Tropilaelaps mercedesae TaxID=418985 RepID=A0A1V9WYI6_9ACAR|nr:hypothetical protein BIW11_14337 [Tropilaelaps mercedesae]
MLSKVTYVLCAVAAVSGSLHHGDEAGHHEAPLVLQSAALDKEVQPITVHEPHYQHGHHDHHSHHGHQAFHAHHHGHQAHQTHYDHRDHHGHHGHDEHGGHNCYQRYKFGYKILDKYGNKQAREEEADEHNNRKGYYSFIDHNGLHRKVEYVADKHGFRATVITNEPGTAKQNPAHVKMLANPPMIDQHAAGYGVGHEAHNKHFTHAEFDPKEAAVAEHGEAPLVKEAAVAVAAIDTPVVTAKEAVVSVPHERHVVPAGIVKAAPVSIDQGALHAHVAPQWPTPSVEPLSKAHAHEGQYGNAHSHGYTSVTTKHAHSYAPVTPEHAHVYAHIAGEHFSTKQDGLAGHKSYGLARQASYNFPAATYSVHGYRNGHVTGGYRRAH